jgi:hypothetical protein
MHMTSNADTPPPSPLPRERAIKTLLQANSIIAKNMHVYSKYAIRFQQLMHDHLNEVQQIYRSENLLVETREILRQRLKTRIIGLQTCTLNLVCCTRVFVEQARLAAAAVHPALSHTECANLLWRDLAPLMSVAYAEDSFLRARRDWLMVSHMEYTDRTPVVLQLFDFYVRKEDREMGLDDLMQHVDIDPADWNAAGQRRIAEILSKRQ